MKSIKPLKRSDELAPLSREHHDGLLFCWKIKQGLVNGTSLETLCNYTQWFWANHIKPHFSDEEKLLAQYLPPDHPYVQQMYEEHARIRELMIRINGEPEKKNITGLADMLHDHIRFEERELFEFAEKTLTADQRKQLHESLSHEHHCDTEWQDEFWVKK